MMKEDKKQRDLAEARNLAENAAYQSEKALADADGKVDDATKGEVEEAVKGVRESLTSESVEEINAKTEALNTAMTKASEQIYAAAQSEGAAEGGAAEGETPDEDDEVVDAEVVDEGDEGESK